MNIAGQTANPIMIIAFLLTISLAIQFARGDDDEEGCGQGCQSIDPDPSQMSRCVRYACRRRVFRYFIRFGKRAGDDDSVHQRYTDQMKAWLQDYRDDLQQDSLQRRQKKQMRKRLLPTLRSDKLQRVQDVIQNKWVHSQERRLIDMLLNLD
uniref:Uncharacterized protein n=1 Tax=Arion vulgaris TaxID=1028688 RepID=A0A0B7AI51_9EUPU